uniref:Uncharacterized protein n=1 Tax=Oryza barthii TaxID=65489 RepID=A0A0D3H624_9ORYZ
MSGHQVESSCTSPTPLRAKERTFFNMGGPCCAQHHGAQIRNRRRSLALGKIAQLADYSELKEHANSRMMPSDSSLYLCDQGIIQYLTLFSPKLPLLLSSLNPIGGIAGKRKMQRGICNAMDLLAMSSA